MKLTFPKQFCFGTSTSAYQIESAIDHDWQGVESKDGYTFDRTTDHEIRMSEDIGIIASLAPHYRMSLMWSKLQSRPFGELAPDAKAFYHQLLAGLRERNVTIMMVLHHFVNPSWFAASGGWANKKNIAAWCDYAVKVVDEFGVYVKSWNTFNEPNLYTTMGYVLGQFPPYRRNFVIARSIIKNIASAHDQIYQYIKEKFPDKPVGISHNCVVFNALNIAGVPVARIADQWYMEYIPSHFTKCDFLGISYYARLSFDPFPITCLNAAQKMKKLGMEHDDLWEFYPDGLAECIRRYWKKYKKPIIITENGISTNDDSKRIKAIRDYMKVIHTALENNIDVRGYYHWSTWDNFEWTLGPTYRFGLYEVDLLTMERKKKPSADLYARLAYSGILETD